MTYVNIKNNSFTYVPLSGGTGSYMANFHSDETATLTAFTYVSGYTYPSGLTLPSQTITFTTQLPITLPQSGMLGKDFATVSTTIPSSPNESRAYYYVYHYSGYKDLGGGQTEPFEGYTDWPVVQLSTEKTEGCQRWPSAYTIDNNEAKLDSFFYGCSRSWERETSTGTWSSPITGVSTNADLHREIYYVPANNTNSDRSHTDYYSVTGPVSACGTVIYPLEDSFTVYQSSAATPEKDIHVDVDEVDVGSASTIVIGNIIESGCNLSSFTYTVSGDVAVSATTGTGNTLVIDVPENDTDSARTGYLNITFYDTDGNSYEQVITVNQDAGTGGEKRIYLDPAVIIAGSGDTGGCTTIVAENCTFSSMTVVDSGGTHYTSGPVVNGDQMCFTFPVNPSANSRSETFSLRFYDTDGNHYNSFIVVQQLASGETQNVPEPWDKPGDTAYTWYRDDNLLKVLPEQRELAFDESTAYWPVTAHTFPSFEVRASGDCPFTYRVEENAYPQFNSHNLYAYTENNTGETQLTSRIKLVAYSGDSAYSATTMLLKDPESDGWITATPNPVVSDAGENSINVSLLITNCQRSTEDEATGNTEFNSQNWVTVSLVNNTALTFNFTANNTPNERTTAYNVCGRDHSNRLISRRIDITQHSNNRGIRITPSRTTLAKPAGSFTAAVQSTEAGTFSFSASSWMTITSYVPSSDKGGTLYIDYSLNSGNIDRIGNIYAEQQITTSPYILTASTAVTQLAIEDGAFITVNPSTVGVGRQAGEVQAQVTYNGLATGPVLVQDAGDMSITSYQLANDTITVVYGANSSDSSKSRTFLVTGTSVGGSQIVATFTITQGGTGEPVAPIWRDYVLDLPTPGQGYINYQVSYDGTVVYTGRAYGMGQSNIQLFFNNICKPFLSNKIDFTPGFQTIREWLGNFSISSQELGTITAVNFFEDYSYENRTMTNTMSLNNPITNEVVEGAPVPFSFFISGNSGSISITEDGVQLTGFTVADNEQHRYLVDAVYGKTYEALGAKYKGISACEARYSLYYVNSYGGVDVLPFKGRSFKKTDNITRFNYSRSFRNDTLEFENVNYMNEIKPVWELHTSYMTDEQSRKMHELVESTILYLYDAQEQKFTPVVTTDKKLEYKTYYNQGRKFYTYVVNVEESQSKERR